MPIRGSKCRQTVSELQGRLRQPFIALASLCFCVTIAAQLPDDQCPEKCGEVLKSCLEQFADRYKRIDVAERCLMECRGSIKTGASDRFINLSIALRHCASGSRTV